MGVEVKGGYVFVCHGILDAEWDKMHVIALMVARLLFSVCFMTLDQNPLSIICPEGISDWCAI